MAQRTIRLTPKTLREVHAYRQALKRAHIPQFRLIVFGSHAKGTAGPDSDIDVAVVSSSFGRDYFREGVNLMHLRSAPYLIEPHPFHPDDLNDRWSSLAQEIKRYGIEIE